MNRTSDAIYCSSIGASEGGSSIKFRVSLVLLAGTMFPIRAWPLQTAAYTLPSLEQCHPPCPRLPYPDPQKSTLQSSPRHVRNLLSGAEINAWSSSRVVPSFFCCVRSCIIASRAQPFSPPGDSKYLDSPRIKRTPAQPRQLIPPALRHHTMRVLHSDLSTDRRAPAPFEFSRGSEVYCSKFTKHYACP